MIHMARARYGPRAKWLLGFWAAVLTGVLGIWVGQLTGGSNPRDAFHIISWPLVCTALVLDYLAVNLFVWQWQRLKAEYRDGWEPWLSFVLTAIGAGIIVLATLFAWTQHHLERFLSFLSVQLGFGWLDTGGLSDQASKASGVMAFIIVICLTNWIWHHSGWMQGMQRRRTAKRGPAVDDGHPFNSFASH